MLTIYAGTGNQQLETLYETIGQTLDKLKGTGITEKELRNSKEQLKGSLMLSLESTNSRMSRNGKNELLLKKHRSLDEIIESVNSVTKEHVDQLIRSTFTDEFSAALISPTGTLPKGITYKS
jgi:predicted Zn-dependent peptidase